MIAISLVVYFLDRGVWGTSSSWWNGLVAYLMGDANRIQLTPFLSCNVIYELASDSEGIVIASTARLWIAYGIVWLAYAGMLAIRWRLTSGTARAAGGIWAGIAQFACSAIALLVIADVYRCALELKPHLLLDGWIIFLIPPILLAHAAVTLMALLALVTRSARNRQSQFS